MSTSSAKLCGRLASLKRRPIVPPHRPLRGRGTVRTQALSVPGDTRRTFGTFIGISLVVGPGATDREASVDRISRTGSCFDLSRPRACLIAAAIVLCLCPLVSLEVATRDARFVSYGHISARE